VIGPELHAFQLPRRGTLVFAQSPEPKSQTFRHPFDRRQLAVSVPQADMGYCLGSHKGVSRWQGFGLQGKAYPERQMS
jgi:hypothetical protein